AIQGHTRINSPAGTSTGRSRAASATTCRRKLPRLLRRRLWTLVEKLREMRDDVPRVVFRTVDETRFAPAQERQTEDVETWRVDDAAVVAEAALLVEDRHVQPAVVGTEARRPHDRMNLSTAEIE